MSLNDLSVAPTQSQSIPAGLANPTGASVYDDNRKANNAQAPFDAYAAAGTRGLGAGEPGVAEADANTLSKTNIEPLEAIDTPAEADRFAASTDASATTVQATAQQAYDQAANLVNQAVDAVKEFTGTK